MFARTTSSPDETRALGAEIGRLLKPGDLVCLIGDLGAGKTTFVQGLAEGWGSLDQVTSPTFVIVNEYHRTDGQRLYHMDAYRLENALEAEDLDIDSLRAVAPLVVEWADRIPSALPDPSFTLRIHDEGGNVRRFEITGEPANG